MMDVEREVVTEDREDIRVLPQDRLSLSDRLAQERGVLDGDELELSEKAWTKQAPETLEEIHAAVDALEVPAEPPTPAEAALWDGAEDLDVPPLGDVPEGVEPLTDVEQQAIAAHVGEEVLRAAPIYRSGRRQVVEVLTRRDSRIQRALLTVLGSDVRNIDDIARAVDRLEAHLEDEDIAADADAAEAEANEDTS